LEDNNERGEEMTPVEREPFEVDVLCVGHAAFDLTMQVDHHPGPDEKCFASSHTVCGGGPAANAAVTVVRLGGSSAFAGYLGEDLYGRRHLEELTSESVNTSLVVCGTHPTPLSVILVKPDGRRSVVNYKGKTPFLPVTDVDFSRCRPKAILFDGHEPLISLPLARTARTRGIPTVLDAGSVHRGTADLAFVVDYLVGSEKFGRDFTGQVEMRQALYRLSEIAPFAAITLGDQGVLWKGDDGSGEMAAFSVDSVDTTGAGDVFHGAFALGVASGWEIRTVLEFSCAAAALSCTKVGARLSIPTGPEVDAFLKKSSRADRP
jgi:sulfofructose kinase